ncbi:hypothetical protein [Furfurilactobacillus curtus]|uniref:Uncharacterized protein n=1 Tax=Furfurilactobacillus curtus TaxID=1746200 RepID=A0ABQ5JLY9_9LACO
MAFLFLSGLGLTSLLVGVILAALPSETMRYRDVAVSDIPMDEK